MIKKVPLLFTVLFICFLSHVEALPSFALDFTITPSEIGQGEVGLLSIQKTGEAKPDVIWMGKKITLLYDKKNDVWAGFIGADLTTRPGRYKLQVNLNNNPHLMEINVLLKDRGVRHLTVPKEMEALDIDTLKRVREESRRMRELFMRSAEYPHWRGDWIKPIASTVVSPFGLRSIINGIERRPHSGVDLKAAEGTHVKATNKGRIVLVANHFFGGLSVVIDHGGGIQSMYFHLSHVFVQAGQLLEKGAIIGLSGSSGRVTGAHLHFGIRLNGGRVDPLKLIEISRRLER